MSGRKPGRVYDDIDFLRALDLKNFGDGFSAAGGGFPMNFIETIAGAVLAQFFEIPSLADLALRMKAQRSAMKKLIGVPDAGRAERILGAGSAELSNGRSISKDDLNLLAAVHEYLAERFARHLSLLRSRVGRS